MPRPLSVLLIIIVLATLAPPDLAAFECRDYRGVRRLLGESTLEVLEARDLVVYGDAAYVIDRFGFSVSVVDIADPNAIATVALLPVPTLPTSIAAGPAGLFVTVPDHGLFRYDLTDPLTPAAIDTLDLGVDLLDVALDGNIAFVAMGMAGARAVALDQPGGMLGLDIVAAPSSVRSVASEGGWLYISTIADGLIVFDASDPLAMQYAGEATFPASGDHITIGHGLVAIAGRTQAGGDWQVRAYDVTTPWQPQIVGTALESGGGSLPPRPTIAATDHLFVAAAGNGLYEFDLVDTHLVRSGFRQPPCAAIHLEASRYVTVGYNQLAIGLPGSLPPTPLADINSASIRPTLRDGLLYAARSSALFVVDATDPANPTRIALRYIPPRPHVPAIALLDETLYITGASANLDIYDIQDLTDIVYVGQVFLARPPLHMVIDDGYLYAAQDGSGLRVLDLADPHQPQVVGSVAFDIGEARAMAMLDDQILIAGRDQGVVVFDVSDPTHPAVVDGIPGPFVADLAVADDRVLVAADDGPLETWIRNAISGDWESLGTGEPLIGTKHLYVSDSIGYAVASNDDIVVLDLAAGGVPVQLATWDPLESTDAIVANEAMVVTVVSSYYYEFLPPQCPLVPTRTPDTAPHATISLAAPAPNPFNPRTRISFELPTATHATLRVYDLRGRCIRSLLDEPLARGTHAVDWNGRDDDGRAVPSGVYHARLATHNATVSRKLTLLK